MHEVLFKVPEYLATAVETGSVHRFGALLKSAETGRIVAHMQETTLGQSIMWKAASSVVSTNPLSFLNVAGNVVQIVQNEQIKRAIATLQSLQVANLVLSGVGIGVSVAGFAVVSAKISRLQAGIDNVGAAVEQLARDMQHRNEDALNRDLAGLKTACRRVDEAWLVSDPAEQWLDAARALHEKQDEFFSMASTVRDPARALERAFRTARRSMADGRFDANCRASGARRTGCRSSCSSRDDAGLCRAHRFNRRIRPNSQVRCASGQTGRRVQGDRHPGSGSGEGLQGARRPRRKQGCSRPPPFSARI